MISPEKVSKQFSISFASALIDCRVTIVQFIKDQADFKNFDEDFATPFEKNWQNAINIATDLPTDEETVDIQSGYTDTVNDTMAACRKIFQDSKYHIEKAFPTKKAVLKEFGFDNYEAARKSVPKMTIFMGVFNKKIAKYKTQLLAVKFPQSSIDSINTLAKALVEQKTDQETQKKSRLSLTEDRITKMNAMWAFRQKVAKASKNIYKNNYSKYRLYLLPASEESGDIYDIQGVVTDKETGAFIEEAKISILDTTQIAITDSNGKYGFVDVTNGTLTINFEAAGYKAATENAVFDGNKIALNVALEKI